MYKAVLCGYTIGLLLTIMFVLYYKRAMPALLFILPMELICILAVCLHKYGVEGLICLMYFDEELALK